MKLKTIKTITLCVFFPAASFSAFSGCAKPEEEKSAARLLQELNDSNPEIRERAATGLYWKGSMQRYVPEMEVPGSEEFEAKRSEIISALRERLNDAEIRVRFEAADALMETDPSGSRDIVIPIILKYASDKNPETRERAVQKMDRYSDELGTKKEEVITALKERLADEKPEIRNEAAIALGRIDPRRFRDILIPLYITMAESREKEYEIAMICKKIGPAAKPLVPALIRLVKMDNQPRFPSVYTDALKSIGTGDALAAVREAEQESRRWRIKGVVLNCVILLCYGVLFGWSVWLRKRGKQVFHWLLLIPIAMYLLCLVLVLKRDPSVMEAIYSTRLFLTLAAIGCIPWLISWFILHRRGAASVPAQKESASLK